MIASTASHDAAAPGTANDLDSSLLFWRLAGWAIDRRARGPGIMAANDIFVDANEIAPDLALLESLRWARKEFLDRICEASESRDDDVLTTLRLEATYQLAEFLYLLRANRIDGEDQIRMLAEMHNQYLVELTEDRGKLNRLGLNRDRLLDAIFTADTLPRLLQHWREKSGTLDQSNLARFLAGLMSTETCRKVVVACGQAGYLVREKSPYGTMFVRSTGALERIFAQCLRDLRLRTESVLP